MADKQKVFIDTAEIAAKLRVQRRARQIIGAIVCILTLTGIFTVVSGGVSVVRNAFDISDEIPMFEERIKYLVALDTLPFDSLLDAPTDTLLYAAMIQAIDTNETDNYETDANGQMYLPVADISAAVEDLYGPDEKFNYITFTSGQWEFEYVPEKEAYLMPLTSPPTDYAPVAEAIVREGSGRRLTVGYDSPYDSVIEPVKYLDFIFERHDDGNYYLTAIVTSALRAQAQEDVQAEAEADSMADAQTLPENNEELLENVGDGAMTQAESAAQNADTASVAAESTQNSESTPTSESEAESTQNSDSADSSSTEQEDTAQ